MRLWGRQYTPRELEALTGDLRQIADIGLATLEDGLERGTRVAHVRTGSGLDFTVLIDRAMDIGNASYNGIPLAWQSGTGAVHPSRYEAEGLGWLRTFHGGLIALCGLTHVGHSVQSEDPQTGELLGLHGRVGHIPAHDIHIDRECSHDQEDWVMRLSGTLDDVGLFGYRLRLKRVLEVTVGKAEIRIHDSVINLGGIPAPLMVLYHCNFGWPIVSPATILSSSALDVRAASPVADLTAWQTMQPPTAGYAEQLFTHVLPSTDKPLSASLFNPELRMGVEITFSSRTLNHLTQWKLMGFSDYVVGLEPGNCLPEGRVRAREFGRLRTLPPGEVEHFSLSIRVIDSPSLDGQG
jgi:hypothetical protein